MIEATLVKFTWHPLTVHSCGLSVKSLLMRNHCICIFKDCIRLNLMLGLNFSKLKSHFKTNKITIKIVTFYTYRDLCVSTQRFNDMKFDTWFYLCGTLRQKRFHFFMCSWPGIAHMVAHWLGDWDLWSAPGSNPSKGESLQKYKEQCICIGNSASKSVFAN